MTAASHLHFVYPGSMIGKNVVIGPYALIGEHPTKEGDYPPVTIGDGAVIRSHTVIYYGNRIGTKFQTGHHAFIRELNEIGDDVSIGTGSIVEHHVKIGNGVRLHSHVFVPEYSVLEDGCWLGPNVVLTNAKYPKSPGAKDSLIGPKIGAGAKIGANATILPGVVIGRDALIGAGSVVVKDVPDRAVVAGNPARFIKNLDKLPY